MIDYLLEEKKILCAVTAVQIHSNYYDCLHSTVWPRRLRANNERNFPIWKRSHWMVISLRHAIMDKITKIAVEFMCYGIV